ncbi:response regulator [Deinococcus sp. Arct2-2]|uniref:response regulator n=1 Tax=Deinococcus sp. Arct2-2 TaxID=2568653 RepID=UPI001F1059C6|nr:response regulator [Deinococcus sp. Arct2-2]
MTDVLVVEDNPADIELMRVTLEDLALPHHLDWVPDGEAALAYLRSFTPRLVLLDLNMPRLGGLEVLHAVRDERLGEFVVVVFSSSAAEQDRQAALALGAAAHVVKPASFDAFCEVFAEVLLTYAPLPANGHGERSIGS